MRDQTGRPVGRTWTIPAESPPAVEAAYAELARIDDQYDEAKVAVAAAEEAAFEAQEADAKAMAAAIREGRDPERGNAELEARLALDAEKAQLRAYDAALDEAGTALADAIDAARADWLTALGGVIGEAEHAYTSAIRAAQEAAAELAETMNVRGWLERFNGAKLAPGGSAPGTVQVMRYVAAARGVHVDVSRVRPWSSIGEDRVDASELLAVAALAVEKPPPLPTAAERRAARHARAEAEREAERTARRRRVKSSRVA